MQAEALESAVVQEELTREIFMARQSEVEAVAGSYRERSEFEKRLLLEVSILEIARVVIIRKERLNVILVR